MKILILLEDIFLELYVLNEFYLRVYIGHDDSANLHAEQRKKRMLTPIIMT